MVDPARTSRRPGRGQLLLTVLGMIGCVALLAIALRGAGLVETPELLSAKPPDSWSYEPTGFRGLHEVLGRLEYRTQRWLRSYLNLPDPKTTLLLALGPDEAQRSIKRQDLTLDGNVAHLREWVEQGGVALLTVPGRRQVSIAGIPLVAEESIDEIVDDLPGDWGPGSERAPSFMETHSPLPDTEADAGDGSGFEGIGWMAPLTERYPDLPIAQRNALKSYLSESGRPPTFEDAGDYEPLLHLGGRAIVLEKVVGDGHAVAVSTPFLFSNGGLRHPGVATTTLALIDALSEGGRRQILIDEYVHGHVHRGGFLRWAWGTPLFYPLATAVIAILLLAWRGAIRLGPPRAERQTPRRAKEEFVLSLAQLYERGGHGAHAAHWVAQGYATRATKLLGHSTQLLDREDLFLARNTEDAKTLLAEARRLHAEYTHLLERTRSRIASPP